MGLVWSDDLESYAGGSVATGRASFARQVKGDDLTKRDIPAFEVGVGLKTPPHKNMFRWEASKKIEEAKVHHGL